MKQDGATTILLSSHVLTEVEATCDRIGLVRGGRMVATGTIDDLKRKAARRVTVELREPVSASLPSSPGRRDRQQHRTGSGCSRCKGRSGRFFRPSRRSLSTISQVEAFKLEDFVARHYAGH